MNTMEILIKSCAEGELKPHQLLGSVRAGEAMIYKDRWARFVKVRPNQYRVEVGNKGDQGALITDTVQTPVEAKLSVISHVVDAVKEPSHA